MDNQDIQARLIALTRLSAEYCAACENAAEMEKDEFVDRMLDILPRLYWEFSDIDAEDSILEEFPGYYADYVDEDYYDSVRRHIEMVLGPDDMFLETFEEDMKYSETPIAASIAESLADLFQPLFNFISVVKDSDGDNMTEAFMQCKDDFRSYWSQTLCNVLRALNHIKYKPSDNE